MLYLLFFIIKEINLHLFYHQNLYKNMFFNFYKYINILLQIFDDKNIF